MIPDDIFVLVRVFIAVKDTMTTEPLIKEKIKLECLTFSEI